MSIKVGDLVKISLTGEGPYVVVAIWKDGCSAVWTRESRTNETCLVVANPDSSPLEKECSGYWFGTAKGTGGCAIVLKDVCTIVGTDGPATNPLLLSGMLLLGVIVFSIAAIVTALV